MPFIFNLQTGVLLVRTANVVKPLRNAASAHPACTEECAMTMEADSTVHVQPNSLDKAASWSTTPAKTTSARTEQPARTWERSSSASVLQDSLVPCVTVTFRIVCLILAHPLPNALISQMISTASVHSISQAKIVGSVRIKIITL